MIRPEELHVVTAVANPLRWSSRIRLYREFERHMLESGVSLTTVECAFGERPHILDDNPRVNHVPVRAKTLVWNKENLLNLGISRLPPDWKYVAWIDADITFRKPDWALETIHALQQYDVIQPWSDAYDLGPHDEHLAAYRSFCRQWWHKQPVAPGGPRFWSFDGGCYDYPHSGYAWAATRQAINWLGGLFELAAMGAGDHHMALALAGLVERSVPGRVTPAYLKHLVQWQGRALHHINGNVGFTWGTIEHSWHGRKSDRRYIDRWQMIVEHAFDPDTDLKRNSFGVLELAGNKPALRHDMDIYFHQRNEDINAL